MTNRKINDRLLAITLLIIGGVSLVIYFNSYWIS